MSVEAQLEELAKERAKFWERYQHDYEDKKEGGKEKIKAKVREDDYYSSEVNEYDRLLLPSSNNEDKDGFSRGNEYDRLLKYSSDSVINNTNSNANRADSLSVEVAEEAQQQQQPNGNDSANEHCSTTPAMAMATLTMSIEEQIEALEKQLREHREECDAIRNKMYPIINKIDSLKMQMHLHLQNQQITAAFDPAADDPNYYSVPRQPIRRQGRLRRWIEWAKSTEGQRIRQEIRGLWICLLLIFMISVTIVKMVQEFMEKRRRERGGGT